MHSFRRLLGLLRPYFVQMLLATLLLALSGALMSVAVAILKPLVNEVLLAGRTAAAAASGSHAGWLDRLEALLPLEAGAEWLRRSALSIPLVIVVLFGVRAVALYFGQYLATRAGAAVIRDLRAQVFNTLVLQSHRFFERHPTGEILSRVLSDVQRVQKASTFVLADLVRVAAMAPCLLVVILVHDWRLSLLALAIVPVLVYPTVRLGKRLRRASSRSQESTAEVASLLTETVSGIRVVQAYGMERREAQRFAAVLGRVLGLDLKAGRAAALSEPVLEVIGAISGGLLFWAAGVQIARGRVDPGDLVVVMAGLVVLFMSLRRLNRVNLEIQQALASAQRVFELLDWPRDIEEPARPVELSPEVSSIRLESVTFSYREGGAAPSDDTVLDRVDLELRRGETVALVGPSGSGKSTIANLVPRFLDPTGGRVTAGGRDLRSVSLGSLRRLLALVTQETIVFDDTARNNITCGRPAPFEAVEAAARAAHADEFLVRLPQGYDTRLGEGGARLSAGQRQRIAIARALFKDAPFLILDEATSALDAESEHLIQDALGTLLRGRGALVIAHRLATVLRADRIVVLDGGRIVEEGPHDALLARGGLYAKLYELQFPEIDTPV